MNTSILIRTYALDADWLVYCFRSIQKFCKGFSSVVVVFPQSSRNAILPLVQQYGFVAHQIPEKGSNGYIEQQLTKIHADSFTNSDFILHVDSDVIFHSHATPYTFFHEGKPIMLYTPYELLDVPWRGTTEKALGIPCPNETMRRFPLIYPRWTYSHLRAHIERLHGMPIEKYAYANTHGFSEFNLLGSLMWHFQQTQFHWIHTVNDVMPEKVAEQFHSYARVNDQAAAKMEGYLR